MTHHADLCGHQIAESVEPLHVSFQVAGLLVITEAALQQHKHTHTHFQSAFQLIAKAKSGKK